MKSKYEVQDFEYDTFWFMSDLRHDRSDVEFDPQTKDSFQHTSLLMVVTTLESRHTCALFQTLHDYFFFNFYFSKFSES